MIPHGGRPWPLLFPYLYCGPLCCTNKSPVHTPNLWFLLFCFLVSFFFAFLPALLQKWMLRAGWDVFLAGVD
jgi:hypothetical protein